MLYFAIALGARWPSWRRGITPGRAAAEHQSHRSKSQSYRLVGCLLRIFPGFDCFCDSLFDVVQLIGERFLFFFCHAVVGRHVLNDLQCGANAREIGHCHVFGFGHCLTIVGKFFSTARAAADRAVWSKQDRQDGNRPTKGGLLTLCCIPGLRRRRCSGAADYRRHLHQGRPLLAISLFSLKARPRLSTVIVNAKVGCRMQITNEHCLYSKEEISIRTLRGAE